MHSSSVRRSYSYALFTYATGERTLFGTLNNEVSHLFYNMTTEMTFPYFTPSPTLLGGGNI
jgi:hypothetical protein